VCCSVLQCVAVCCSVLQCDALSSSGIKNLCDMTHLESCVAFSCSNVSQPIDVCDVTHSYVTSNIHTWYESFIYPASLLFGVCETCHICVCDMTHSYGT